MSNRTLEQDGLIALGKRFYDLLSPSVKESVVRWVEAETEIPVGPIIGNTRLRPTPYLREPLERIGDKETRYVTLCFGTQAGKTLLMILGMLYRICRDGQDAMWVLPNGDLAKSFSKSRWQKFVRACKQASILVPKTHRGEFDKSLFGMLEQHFLNLVLNFVGSNSPANLSSRPVGLLWMDETDKYGDQAKYEAAAIQLAEERTKNYPFPLVVKSSTPTWANRMIWQEWLSSDQRHYFLPCPRCSREIRLQFTVKTEDHGKCGLRWWEEDEEEAKTEGKWDYDKVKANAHYRCQLCGKRIDEFERPGMLEHGIWRPQNPLGKPGHFGYQLSSMYSIISQATSFSGVAIEWLAAGNSSKKRQNFINSWLAEPWDDIKGFDLEEVKTEQIVLPGDGTTAIMGVDTQEDHWWVVVGKFTPPSEEFQYGRQWIVCGERVETEERLVEIQLANGVANEDVLCDIKWRPKKVSRMIAKYGWRGIKGSETTRSFDHNNGVGPRDERIYSPVKWRDPGLEGWEARGFKRVFYIAFSKHDALDLVNSLRWMMKPQCSFVTLNMHPDFSEHMNSRVKMQRFNKNTGVPEWFWRELHQKNHLADAMNFIHIQALIKGLLTIPPETDRQNRS